MNRPTVSTVAALLVALAWGLSAPSVPALADDPAPAPAPTPAPAPATTPSSGPAKPAALPPLKLTLTSAGAEPRQVLRYQLRAGAKDRLQIVQKQKTMTTTESGPISSNLTTITTCDFEVLAVDPSGPASIRMSMYDMKLEMIGLPSQGNVLEGLRLGFTGRMSSRGAWTDAKVAVEADPSGKLGAIMDQLLSGLGQTVEQSSVPLPEEVVGLGATWTVEGSVATMGAQIETKSEMTLESLSEGVLRLVGKSTGGTKDQDMALPQAPGAPKVEMHIAEMTITGGVAYDVDLSQGLPTSATVTARTVTKMSVKVPGAEQAQEVESDGTAEMTLQRKK